MNDNKIAEATPDQLLKILELQMATQRSKRRHGARHRGLILAGGLFLIIAGALAAFLILQQMVLDLPQRGERTEAAAATSAAH